MCLKTLLGICLLVSLLNEAKLEIVFYFLAYKRQTTTELLLSNYLNSPKGPFKYYISKEVGGWRQKMALFADLQYYLC